MKNVAPTLGLGYDNFVMTEKIVVVAEYDHGAIRNIIRDYKKNRPDDILDLSTGRRRLSVIICTTGLLIITSIPRKQLHTRLLEPELKSRRSRQKNASAGTDPEV